MPLFEEAGGARAYAQTEPMDIYLCVTDRFATDPQGCAFMAFLKASLGDEWKVKART